MSNLVYLPELKELKKCGVIDHTIYQEMNKALTNHKKFLILAPKNCGKNTYQHIIINHLHRIQKDPLVVPSIERIPLKNFNIHPKIKNMKKVIKEFKSYVVTIQHTGSTQSDTSNLAKNLLPHFNLIIDLRILDGNRTIGHLIKGRKKINYIYINPELDHFSSAA